MPRYATVSSETTVILHTGRPGTVPAGRYEVAELDGHRPENGSLFLTGPNGDLVRADLDDPNITIQEG